MYGRDNEMYAACGCEYINYTISFTYVQNLLQHSDLFHSFGATVFCYQLLAIRLLIVVDTPLILSAGYSSTGNGYTIHTIWQVCSSSQL